MADFWYKYFFLVLCKVIKPITVKEQDIAIVIAITTFKTKLALYGELINTERERISYKVVLASLSIRRVAVKNIIS